VKRVGAPATARLGVEQHGIESSGSEFVLPPTPRRRPPVKGSRGRYEHQPLAPQPSRGGTLPLPVLPELQEQARRDPQAVENTKKIGFEITLVNWRLPLQACQRAAGLGRCRRPPDHRESVGDKAIGIGGEAGAPRSCDLSAAAGWRSCGALLSAHPRITSPFEHGAPGRASPRLTTLGSSRSPTPRTAPEKAGAGPANQLPGGMPSHFHSAANGLDPTSS